VGRPNRVRPLVIIGCALLSPIAGCLMGWVLGAAVWRAERPDWSSLGAPPQGVVHIVGIAFPEDSAYAPPTVYVSDGTGSVWFYRSQGSDANKWVASTESCAPCGGWLQQACRSRVYPFLPDAPGRTLDCAEYLPPVPEGEEVNPEVFLSRYVLLDDGSIWRWKRPVELVGARQIYPCCGLILGIMGMAALGLLVLRGGVPAGREVE
jgi:hypothetical protein